MRQHVTIRQDGERVHLIIGGRLVADLSPEAACEVARGLRYQAGKAEEVAQRERAVMDQAILMRAGMPVGLLHDRHLVAQAVTEAAWNSRLRRFMPGGVQSREVFGVPAIIQQPPRKGQADVD